MSAATEGFEALTREQQKQMLEWFMYRLGADPQREDLAGALPAAYNAWCGSEIVKVVSVKDPERVWRTTRTDLVVDGRVGRFIKVRVGESAPALTDDGETDDVQKVNTPREREGNRNG
jgi:hypothetical protein